MKAVRVLCDHCEPLVINGMACHETGCPASEERWVRKGRGWKTRMMPESQELPRYLRETPARGDR